MAMLSQKWKNIIVQMPDINFQYWLSKYYIYIINTIHTTVYATVMLSQITYIVDTAAEHDIQEAADYSNMNKHLVAVEGM